MNFEEYQVKIANYLVQLKIIYPIMKALITYVTIMLL